ncbi:MAG: hypothetical protein WDN00_12330 [Limisphaerales bacterium]
MFRIFRSWNGCIGTRQPARIADFVCAQAVHRQDYLASRLNVPANRKRSLGDVFRFDEKTGGPLSTQINSLCKGLRPWLGDVEAGGTPCGHHLRVLQRGASNVYFSPHRQFNLSAALGGRN